MRKAKGDRIFYWTRRPSWTAFGLSLGFILILTAEGTWAADDPSGRTSYRVTEDTPSLGEAALFLYGKARMFHEIARWNQISPPYVIHTGQILVLEKSPTLSAEEGTRRVLAFWRRKLGLHQQTATEQAAEPEIKIEPTDADLQQAVVEMEQKKTPNARTAETHLNEGEKRMASGDCTSAIANFQAALALDPENLAAGLQEIHCLRLLRRSGEAKTTAAALLKLHPELTDLPILKNLSREVSR